MDILAYFKQRCELDRSINLHYAKVRQYADDQPRYPKETTYFVDENAFNFVLAHFKQLIGYLTVIQNKVMSWITSHIRSFVAIRFCLPSQHVVIDKIFTWDPSRRFPNKIRIETLSVKFEKIQSECQ